MLNDKTHYSLEAGWVVLSCLQASMVHKHTDPDNDYGYCGYSN